MDRPLSVAALRCRTSDRTPGASRGAEALALALDPDARLVGEFGDARIADWSSDIVESRPCIERAGELVGEMLDAGSFPVLTASDCTICLTTFSAVVARVPDVKVLWFDAHGDSNTPETTPSGFLGGMCLGASVGLWESGFEKALAPERVYGVGIRDLDPGEWAPQPFDSSQGPWYVHLDLDCLDPSVFPAQFAVPGGLSFDEVRDVLGSLPDVVGVEVTAFEEPEGRVEEIAALVRAVLP
jgi:arginase family enzyme